MVKEKEKLGVDNLSARKVVYILVNFIFFSCFEALTDDW